ncbi:MAG: cytochrome c1 [Thiotrichaceae bacterium]|nr:cytochrome c1 [Thiotrichaceae bacterium]
MRNSLVILLSGLLISGSAFAGSKVALESASIDVDDHKSLQRGTRNFMNYCHGCHSLSSSRYNRVAKDIGLPVVPADTGASGKDADQIAGTNAKLITENFIFTRGIDGKPSGLGSLMHNAMPSDDVKNWYGGVAPDLSLTGRSRGADWIYTYLKSFYLDPERPSGMNNTILANASMPHVLWDLQGNQKLVEHIDEEGHKHSKLVLETAGSLSPEEYDEFVNDITNFLVYVGEPAQLARKKYGIFAMLLLLMFIGVAYALKKEYWKDVH